MLRVLLTFVLLVPFALAQETPEPASCPEGQALTEIGEGAFACKPVPGYVPPEQPPDERFLYTGHVEIETLAFDEMKSRLEAQGCGTQGITDGCFYEEREFILESPEATGMAVPIGEEAPQEEPSGIDVLIVHPTGASFGPTDFALTETRLYAPRDIEGSRDDEKFKAAVEAEVAGLDGFVTLKRETWTITARDSTGIVYAMGGNSGLLSFVESVERQPSNQPVWFIPIAFIGLAAFAFAAYRKLR
ncbi:MAG: hypothetical protein HY366_03425 [Candidatus Aenigmarchaeota archaeon]|nr:hypothetical protein [Candidatus Aenigmarchaeota archaeon]